MYCNCNKCYDENYEAIMCCSGRDCGCRGVPIDFRPCPICNPDEKKEVGETLKADFPFFFGGE